MNLRRWTLGHLGGSVGEMSARVINPGSWNQVLHWAPCSVRSLLLLLPLPLLVLPLCLSNKYVESLKKKDVKLWKRGPISMLISCFLKIFCFNFWPITFRKNFIFSPFCQLQKQFPLSFCVFFLVCLMRSLRSGPVQVTWCPWVRMPGLLSSSGFQQLTWHFHKHGKKTSPENIWNQTELHLQ